MSKNKRSKKHHYLPRHYLKGFSDSSERFYVYDKKTKDIFVSSPDNSFFENNLNTIEVDDEKSDWLETLYSEIEGGRWDSFDKIRNSKHQQSISIENRLELLFFISILFWRLPSNFKYLEEVSKNLLGNDLSTSIFKLKNKNGEIVNQKVVDNIKSKDFFKKSSRIMASFLPFYDNYDVSDWVFSYTEDGGIWHVVGDNPLITRKKFNLKKPAGFLDEFIFPVSGNIILINGYFKNKSDLSNAFILQFNIAIIHNSKRFVAFHNKEKMEAFIKYYNFYVDNKRETQIISDMFNLL